jgi:hypothetical protein
MYKYFAMKSNYIIIFLLSATCLVGCKSGSSDGNGDGIDSTNVEIDSTIAIVDSTSSAQDTITDKVHYDNPEVQEAHKEIVKKYGVQWDFCTCVQKSDSVNTALMEASDDDFDVVMVRSEYIDSKCKGLLIQPNGTPEERYKHQKKVKNCLSK